MSGIAGIAREGRTDQVRRMLERIGHRGDASGYAITEVVGATLGIIKAKAQPGKAKSAEARVLDFAGESHFAEAAVFNEQFYLCRDHLGISPLYYGRTEDGALCFSSEVKALLELTKSVEEFPPGHRLCDKLVIPYFQIKARPPLEDSPDVIVKELHRRLDAAVKKAINNPTMGVWLSGGLDSSAIAALARPHVDALHTFAGGLKDAPDLEYAREVARHIDAQHHEVLLTQERLLEALPKVIFHLESFDALLVRSSIVNYLVGQRAAEHVAAVFSGEGGDELFAGYDYLKALPVGRLADELVDITNRLHNTALQRVDRCASAHGLVAHVGFLDNDVVDYALRIPVELKIRDGVEKWILRRAMDGALPERVLNRRKAKFWEGAGVGECLARRANDTISDNEFGRKRHLPNGWTLNSKEELMYYRIFEEHFGRLENLSWMGRTKGAPSDSEA
ncbi:MAG: asparagine synthase-related protein [Candidatus Sumerlaeota bacterium]|nr:asparagine synthase-related protein [Candidatus Sumerlaeota bacterium]